MSHFNVFHVLLASLDIRPRLGPQLLHSLFVLGDIAGFFNNLYGQLTLFALAMATFFFAWAAILYTASGITGNERTKTHAIGALYAALVGLALAILAGTVAGIISTAATGQ